MELWTGCGVTRTPPVLPLLATSRTHLPLTPHTCHTLPVKVNTWFLRPRSLWLLFTTCRRGIFVTTARVECVKYLFFCKKLPTEISKPEGYRVLKEREDGSSDSSQDTSPAVASDGGAAGGVGSVQLPRRWWVYCTTSLLYILFAPVF